MGGDYQQRDGSIAAPGASLSHPTPGTGFPSPNSDRHFPGFHAPGDEDVSRLRPRLSGLSDPHPSVPENTGGGRGSASPWRSAHCDHRRHLRLPRGQRRHVLCADCTHRAGSSSTYAVTFTYATVGLAHEYAGGGGLPGCAFEAVGGSAGPVPPGSPAGATAFSHGFHGQRAPGVSLEGEPVDPGGGPMRNAYNGTLPTALAVCLSNSGSGPEVVVTVNNVQKRIAMGGAAWKRDGVDTGGDWHTMGIVVSNATMADMSVMVALDGWTAKVYNPGDFPGPLNLTGSSLIVGRGFPGAIGEWLLHTGLPAPTSSELRWLTNPIFGAASDLPDGHCDVVPGSRVPVAPVSRLTFARTAEIDCGPPLWWIPDPQWLSLHGGTRFKGHGPDATGAPSGSAGIPSAVSIRGADSCAPSAEVTYVIPTATTPVQLGRWNVTGRPLPSDTTGFPIELRVDVRQAVLMGHLDPECGNLVVLAHRGPVPGGASPDTAMTAEPVDFWVDPVFGCAPGFPIDVETGLTKEVRIVVRLPRGATVPSARAVGGGVIGVEAVVALSAIASRSPGTGHLSQPRVFDWTLLSGVPQAEDPASCTLFENKAHLRSADAAASETLDVAGGALRFDTAAMGTADFTLKMDGDASPNMIGIAFSDDLAGTPTGGGALLRFKFGTQSKIEFGIDDSVAPGFYTMSDGSGPTITTGIPRSVGWHRVEVVYPPGDGMIMLNFDGDNIHKYTYPEPKDMFDNANIVFTAAAGGTQHLRGGIDSIYRTRLPVRVPAAVRAQPPVGVVPLCGNGVLDPGESCDDGNYDRYDGCRSCMVTTGFRCTGEPSVCIGGPVSCGGWRLASPEKLDPEAVYTLRYSGSSTSQFQARCMQTAEGRAWTKIVGAPNATYAPGASSYGVVSPPPASFTSAYWKYDDSTINDIARAGKGSKRYYLMSSHKLPDAYAYIESPRELDYDETIYRSGMWNITQSMFCSAVDKSRSLLDCVLPVNTGTGDEAWFTVDGAHSTTHVHYVNGGLFDTRHIVRNSIDDCRRILNFNGINDGGPFLCYGISATLRCWKTGTTCPGTGSYPYIKVDFYVSAGVHLDCGDGVLDAPHEACDDGNTLSGDGCSSRCQPEHVSSPRSFEGSPTCAALGASHPLLVDASMPHPAVLLGGAGGSSFATRCWVDPGDKPHRAFTRVKVAGTAHESPVAARRGNVGLAESNPVVHSTTEHLSNAKVREIAGNGTAPATYRFSLPPGSGSGNVTTWWLGNVTLPWDNVAPSMGLRPTSWPAPQQICAFGGPGDNYGTVTHTPALIDHVSLKPHLDTHHACVGLLATGRVFMDHDPYTYSCSWTGNVAYSTTTRCPAGPGPSHDPISLDVSVRAETGCGDGVRSPGEECDDGNDISGDGCSAACLVEPRWVCMPRLGQGGTPSSGGDVCAMGTSCRERALHWGFVGASGTDAVLFASHTPSPSPSGLFPSAVGGANGTTVRVHCAAMRTTPLSILSWEASPRDGWVLVAAVAARDGGIDFPVTPEPLFLSAGDALSSPSSSSAKSPSTGAGLGGAGSYLADPGNVTALLLPRDRHQGRFTTVLYALDPVFEEGVDPKAYRMRSPVYLRYRGVDRDTFSIADPSDALLGFLRPGSLPASAGPTGLEVCFRPPLSELTPTEGDTVLPVDHCRWETVDTSRAATLIAEMRTAGGLVPLSSVAPAAAADNTSAIAGLEAMIAGDAPNAPFDTLWAAGAAGGRDDCARLRAVPAGGNVTAVPFSGTLSFASGSDCADPRLVRVLARTAVCGDGAIDHGAGEECDDGNADPGDGCSAECTLESRLCWSPGAPAGSGPVPGSRLPGSSAAFNGYCDQDTDGGRWLLASRFASTGSGGFAANASALARAAIPWTHGTPGAYAAPVSPAFDDVSHDAVDSLDWRKLIVPGNAYELRTRCEKGGTGTAPVDVSYRFAAPAWTAGRFAQRGDEAAGSSRELAPDLTSIVLANRTVIEDPLGVLPPSYSSSSSSVAGAAAERDYPLRLWLPLDTSAPVGAEGSLFPPNDVRNSFLTACPTDPEDVPGLADPPAGNWSNPNGDSVLRYARGWCLGSTAASGGAVPAGASGVVAARRGPRTRLDDGGSGTGNVSHAFRDPGIAYLPDTRLGRDLATVRGKRSVYGLSGDPMVCAIFVREVPLESLPVAECGPRGPGEPEALIRIVRGARTGAAIPLLCDYGFSGGGGGVDPAPPLNSAQGAAGSGWRLLSRFSLPLGPESGISTVRTRGTWDYTTARLITEGFGDGAPVDDILGVDADNGTVPLRMASHRFDELLVPGHAYNLRYDCTVFDDPSAAVDSDISIVRERRSAAFAVAITRHARVAQEGRYDGAVEAAARSLFLTEPTPLTKIANSEMTATVADELHMLLPPRGFDSDPRSPVINGCHSGSITQVGSCDIRRLTSGGIPGALSFTGIEPNNARVGPIQLPYLSRTQTRVSYTPPSSDVQSKVVPQVCSLLVSDRITDPDAAGIPRSCMEVHLQRPGAASGFYLVAPEAVHGGARGGPGFFAGASLPIEKRRSPPRPVYCDLAESGGPNGNVGPGWMMLMRFTKRDTTTDFNFDMHERLYKFGLWMSGVGLDVPSPRELTLDNEVGRHEPKDSTASLDWHQHLKPGGSYWLRQRCVVIDGSTGAQQRELVDTTFRLEYKGQRLVQGVVPNGGYEEHASLALSDRHKIFDNSSIPWQAAPPASAFGPSPIASPARMWLPSVFGVTKHMPVAGGCDGADPSNPGMRTVYTYRNFLCEGGINYAGLGEYSFRYWGVSGIASQIPYTPGDVNMGSAYEWLPYPYRDRYSKSVPTHRVVAWSFADYFGNSNSMNNPDSMRCSYWLRDAVRFTLDPEDTRVASIGDAARAWVRGGVVCLTGEGLPQNTASTTVLLTLGGHAAGGGITVTSETPCTSTAGVWNATFPAASDKGRVVCCTMGVLPALWAAGPLSVPAVLNITSETPTFAVETTVPIVMPVVDTVVPSTASDCAALGPLAPLTVTGANWRNDTNPLAIVVGGTPCLSNVTFVSESEIVCAVPPWPLPPGAHPVSVLVDTPDPQSAISGATAAATVTVLPPRPTITAVDPPGVVVGAPAGLAGPVRINGTNLASGVTGAMLGAAFPCASISIVSDAYLECTVTAPASIVPVPASAVTVTHTSGCGSDPAGSGPSTLFSVFAPLLTAVTPVSPLVNVAPGIPLVFTLSGDHFPAQTAVLDANATVAGNLVCAPVAYISASSVTCTAIAPSSLNTTVTGPASIAFSLTPGWAGTAVHATVTPSAVSSVETSVTTIAPNVAPPIVQAVNPSTGPVAGGTAITINGTDLAAPSGMQTIVTVGSVPCTQVVVIAGSASLTCVTGASATISPVAPVSVVVAFQFSAGAVFVTSGASGDGLFTYTALPTASTLPTPAPTAPPSVTFPAPVVTAVWPRHVPTTGGIALTLTGSFPDPLGTLVEISAVGVASSASATPCSPIVSSSATTVVCIVPASAAKGAATVTAVSASDAARSAVTAATVVEYVEFSEEIEWVQVEGQSPAVTGEDGTMAQFTVRSKIDLTADVTIVVDCDDDTEAVAVPSSVTLSMSSPAQSFALVGIPDDLRDGNVTYSCVVTTQSVSPAFNGEYLATILAVNLDTFPQVLAVRPTVVPMAGGVRVTVYGRHFDRNVTITAGGVTTISRNATARTVFRSDIVANARRRGGEEKDLVAFRDLGDEQQQGLYKQTLDLDLDQSKHHVYIRQQADADATAGLDFPAGSDAAVVYESPVLDLEGYQDITVRNDDTRSGTGTGTALLFMSKDCPFPGQYGLGTTCRDCPTGGICPGGNRMWPMQGYWNPGENSGFVERCDPPEACLGCSGAETSSSCYVATPPCAVGYTGDYCGECTSDPRYTRVRGRCEPCPETGAQALSIVLFLLLWLIVSLAGCLLEQREDFSHVAQLVIAVQEVYGVGSMVRFALPGWASAVYDVLVLFSGDITFAKVDCTGAFDPNTDFFIALAFNVAIGVPMHLLVLVVQFFAVRRARSRGGEEAASERRLHYACRRQRLYTAHATLVYLAVATRCLGILTCFPVGGDLRLATRKSHSCFEGIHIAATALAALVLVAFTAGFPALYFMRVMKGRDPAVLYDDRVYRESRDFLYEPYRPRDRYLWMLEFGVSVSIATASTVLVDHPIVQLLLTGTVFGVFALGILVRRPFVRAYENYVFFALQSSNVVAALVVYLSNTGAVGEAGIKALVYVLVALAGGVLITFLAVALGAIFMSKRRVDDDDLGLKPFDESGENAFAYEYDYEYQGDSGAVAVDGEAPESAQVFSASDPSTWLSLFGVGQTQPATQPTGGEGGNNNNNNNNNNKQRHRIGRRRVPLPTAAAGGAAATAGAAAGAAAAATTTSRTSAPESSRAADRREGGEPALPATVPLLSSPKVIPRAYESPSPLSGLLTLFGMGPRADSTEPVAPEGLSGSESLLLPVADVTPFQRLVDDTAVDFSGGADNPDLRHTSLEVVSVERVVNRTQWAHYAGHARVLASQLAEEKRAPPFLSLATDAHAERVIGHPPARGVNEVVTMHGTRPGLVPAIVNDGLDPRVGNAGGMFGGAAIYLAENSSKADQYAEPDPESGGLCAMFVVRAIAGHPYVASSGNPFRRPPCIPEGHAGQPCDHPKFDSVLGEVAANVQGATLQKHRELMLYDRAKAYPAFLIRYRRK